MKYTHVYICDWERKESYYKIIRYHHVKDKSYSVTFINSIGDIEKTLVDESRLFSIDKS